MTKREIVINISDEMPHVRQMDVAEIVQSTIDMIAEHIGSGESIELRNFGSFKIVRRKARIGRNPKNPTEKYDIPERLSVSFKPSKRIENLLKKRL